MAKRAVLRASLATCSIEMFSSFKLFYIAATVRQEIARRLWGMGGSNVGSKNEAQVLCLGYMLRDCGILLPVLLQSP